MIRAGSAVSDSSTAPSTDCSASRFCGGATGPFEPPRGGPSYGEPWPLVRSGALIGRSSLGLRPVDLAVSGPRFLLTPQNCHGVVSESTHGGCRPLRPAPRDGRSRRADVVARRNRAARGDDVGRRYL